MAASPETAEAMSTSSAPQVKKDGGRFWASSWPYAILLLLATIPYAGILGNDFQYAYDDQAQIIDNPYVHSFRYLKETFTTNIWSHKGALKAPSYYRPMMTVGFLFCYQVFGPLAYGFHLASLLLHAAVVGMVFLVAHELLRDRGAAFAAAAWFAIHPVHVENLAWISDVNDLEMALFYLFAFWCFLRVPAPGGRRRVWAQAGMGVGLLFALLSKEAALTLPALATGYEHFYRGDRRQTTWGQKALRYAALWLVAGVYVPARIRFLGSLARTPGMHQLTSSEIFLSGIALVGKYLGKLIWPAHLSAFYAFQANAKWYEVGVLTGFLALLILTALFCALWKYCQAPSFGIICLLWTLAPVLDAQLMTLYVFAERYLYLPSFGFCLLLGWASAELWRLSSRRRPACGLLAPAVAGVIAALFFIRIVTRIPVWRDDIRLFARTLAEQPYGRDQYSLRDTLGQAYWARGDYAAAEQQWREALRLVPNSPQPLFELGVTYAKRGQLEEATTLFKESLRFGPRQSDAHLNLGLAYAEMGRMDEAGQEFRAAVALAPLNFNAHNVLGKLYFDSGRLPEAEEQFRASLQCESNLAAYDYLGYIYEKRHDTTRAEQSFQSAIAFNAADSHAHFHLGLIYSAAGRRVEAVQELQAALKADPNNSEIRKALAGLDIASGNR